MNRDTLIIGFRAILPTNYRLAFAVERAFGARAPTWTPAKVQLLLKNPKLDKLASVMQKTLDEVRYNTNND
ncbi:MAG TPA: hypothetical protein VFQ70_04020 [Candidatus Saccharimonadaceae bacterium]|nr:hypothetical protein [Candidatus Saccharimonadaceae bacterium]